MATDYTTTQIEGGNWRDGQLYLRTNTVTIATPTDAAVAQLLDVYQGEQILGIGVRVDGLCDKVASFTVGKEGGDVDGFVVGPVLIGTSGTVGTEYRGSGALLGTTGAVIASADTLDATLSVTSGPATTSAIVTITAIICKVNF